MLELGAGCGCYTDYFKWMGFRIHAYDVTENILKLTDGLVSGPIDLATKQTLKPADWVLTLEVGEHIPPQFMDTFLSNVVRHARHGVVMSWARPGQTRPGEPAHPNELSNIRVIAEMKKLGMRFDKKSSGDLRRSAGTFCCPWFKETLMVFKK